MCSTLGIGLTILFIAGPHAAGPSDEADHAANDARVISIVRIGFGIVFVLAAPSTRLPGFVWAFGLLMVFSGVALPIMGFDRLSEAGRTGGSEKPDGVIRGWALLADPAWRTAGLGRDLSEAEPQGSYRHLGPFAPLARVLEHAQPRRWDGARLSVRRRTDRVPPLRRVPAALPAEEAALRMGHDGQVPAVG